MKLEPTNQFVLILLLSLYSGEEAKKLFNDAQKMLTDIINRKLLKCSGVVGFYRAHSTGDDIELLDDSGNHLSVLHGLRQQVPYRSCVMLGK
jgi:cobalamin-dependent methionine synthase I